MWRKRIGARPSLLCAVVVLVITMTEITVAAGAAPAAPGDPLYGDLNGDGLPDRVTLGVAPPNRCTVATEMARADGTYLPPQRYTYVEPGAGSFGACPDLGVVVDLGGNGSIELVLAWFNGRPPGYIHDLLVLRDFTPSTGFDALFQPSSIGLADFNGDGRQDVYEWTDQGQGFATFLNTSAGTLVPGPVKWCSGPPQYVLSDFDHNGAMDVTIAYFEGCDVFFSGVVVVLDDGRVINLEGNLLGEEVWRVGVVDANTDGIPDIVTENLMTNEISHFINNGGASFQQAPIANNDSAVVSPTRKTAIPVLANDIYTTQTRLTIVTPPSYGRVTVTSSRTVVYTPNSSHGPRDRFVYRLTLDGRSDNAAVNLRFSS